MSVGMSRSWRGPLRRPPRRKRTGPAQDYAYYPGFPHQYERISGDVWVADPRANGSNGQLSPGFFGLQTLNHELGHSLVLRLRFSEQAHAAPRGYRGAIVHKIHVAGSLHGECGAVAALEPSVL